MSIDKRKIRLIKSGTLPHEIQTIFKEHGYKTSLLTCVKGKSSIEKKLFLGWSEDNEPVGVVAPVVLAETKLLHWVTLVPDLEGYYSWVLDSLEPDPYPLDEMSHKLLGMCLYIQTTEKVGIYE